MNFTNAMLNNCLPLGYVHTMRCDSGEVQLYWLLVDSGMSYAA